MIRVVDFEMASTVAVIVVVPVATGVALPKLPAVLLMVATDVADEFQVAEVVRSWVVLSEKVPVTVNCWFVPVAMLGFVGETVRDTSVADVTVRVVVTETLPDVAVMVAVPVAMAVALPLLPVVLLMVATDEADELQITKVVRSWVVLSEKVPVALNC